MGKVYVQCRPLLEKMGSDASCIAAAMFAGFIRGMVATSGFDVAFHAEYSVCMMMMRDNRHGQHQYVDYEQ